MGLDVRNLTLLHVNNKGVDQPARTRMPSLISTFVIHLLESITSSTESIAIIFS